MGEMPDWLGVARRVGPDGVRGQMGATLGGRWEWEPDGGPGDGARWEWKLDGAGVGQMGPVAR